jgi:uncharacterized protein YihD (DUF1040 family)
MRDPNRIEPILEEIRRIWTAYPDLRLTQLLVNVIRPSEPCPQVFSFEDDELLKRLRRETTDRWVTGELS